MKVNILVAVGFMHLAGTATAEELTATPYRPTVANPAALSAPGHVEMEFGLLHASGGDAHTRDSLPVLLKYAFSDRFGLLIGNDLRVNTTDHDGEENQGIGDTTLLFKFNRRYDETSAFGLEAGVKVPTARHTIGSGKADYIANGIYSKEWNAYTIDINAGYSLLGFTENNESRHAFSWAACAGKPLNEHWGVALEFSGIAQRNKRATNQVLSAVNYNVTKRVVLDGGVAFGLSDKAINNAVFLGTTVLF